MKFLHTQHNKFILKRICAADDDTDEHFKFTFFLPLLLFSYSPLYLRKLIECVCVGLTQKKKI